MNVTTIIFIGISVLLLIILLFRSSSNRSRVHRDNESLYKGQDIVDRSGNRDKELEKVSNDIERSSDNIQGLNGTAKDAITRAERILERAKNRNPGSKDT